VERKLQGVSKAV